MILFGYKVAVGLASTLILIFPSLKFGQCWTDLSYGGGGGGKWNFHMKGAGGNRREFLMNVNDLLTYKGTTIIPVFLLFSTVPPPPSPPAYNERRYWIIHSIQFGHSSKLMIHTYG